MATTGDDGIIREERTHAVYPTTERVRVANGSLGPLQDNVVLPVGPRVRWGGILSGIVIAIGILMLLLTLGIAIGVSTIANPLAMHAETAKDFATGAGLWTAGSLLLAYFIAGLVSTKVTDLPDRGGAVLHGTLVWVLLTAVLSWLISSGVSIGLSGLGSAAVRAQQGINPGPLMTEPGAVSVDELARTLGLDDPTQVASRLADPRLPIALAEATNTSGEEAQAALNDLQARVAATQGDPAAINTEVRNFLAQLLAQAQQQAPQTAANLQQKAEAGSWITLGTMVVTLLVAIIGAFTGIPSRRRWRARAMRTASY